MTAFTAEEERVIVARLAYDTPATLAKVFLTTPQHIRAIRDRHKRAARQPEGK